jgi:hypothetical protein
MAKWVIALICGGVVMLVMGAILLFWCIGLFNSEARMRNQIVAKQKDNTNEYDNTWKKISQAAQVTDAQKQALMDIIVGNSKARAGNGNGGQLATFVHEAVPNIDTSTFNQLMNIVTSARDGFTMRQKELLDFKREHDNLMDTFPGSLLFSLLGKTKIDVTIVTSSRTEDAFKTGKDDDVDVFQKKAPVEK